MPWKDGYTVSDETSLFDHEVVWPDEQRCCFTVVVDLSLAKTGDGVAARDIRGADAMFGLEDGMNQLRAILDRHEIRATFAVPAVMAPMMSKELEQLRDAGHEIAPNGLKHEDIGALDLEEERGRLELTTEIFTDLLGEAPAGWYSLPRQSDPFALGTVSDHTIGLLREQGYRYFGNGSADDIPFYWVSDFDRAEALLAMPYYYHFDDQFFLLFPRKGTGLEHADSLYRNWRAEFDAQYRRGRQFSMTLHPYAVGWCHRAGYLDRFFDHVSRCPGVWNPTVGGCADYWLEAYPREKTLKLEASIWQDYPDSLS